MKISKLMRGLGIKYYDFSVKRNTLIIYEPIPVKVLPIIRKELPGIAIEIK